MLIPSRQSQAKIRYKTEPLSVAVLFNQTGSYTRLNWKRPKAKQNKQEYGFLDCRELHLMFLVLQKCILHIPVIAFIFLVKLTYHAYLWNEDLPQSFDTVMLPKSVYNLIKINLSAFWCYFVFSLWVFLKFLEQNRHFGFKLDSGVWDSCVCSSLHNFKTVLYRYGY
jgi:hypothetical protein